MALRSFEATADADLRAIERVEIVTSRVEVDNGADRFSIDGQPRTIVIRNSDEDQQEVALFRVPVGSLSKIRIFPKAVTVYLRSGGSTQSRCAERGRA